MAILSRLAWILAALLCCLCRASQAGPTLTTDKVIERDITTETIVSMSSNLAASHPATTTNSITPRLSSSLVPRTDSLTDSVTARSNQTLATTVALPGANHNDSSDAISTAPALPPQSSTTITTMTDTSTTTTPSTPTIPRFDFESSAESFESSEATSTNNADWKSSPMVDAEPSIPDESEPLEIGVASSTLSASSLTIKSPIIWPWMLFILNGNVTVANRRQRDLGTYLRLNLAARLDADYNDVAINKILFTPLAILANISVEPSHLIQGGTGAAGLDALGQGNVTLLELSGHEFQVDRIIRFDEAADQRGVISSMEMSSMTATVTSEVTVYGAVGAVFLFLLVALLLGLSFSNPCKFNDDGKYLGNSNFAYDRDQLDNNYSDGSSEWKSLTTSAVISPPVIYTEQLARQMGSGFLTPGRFIPSRPSTPVTATTLAELHHYNTNSQEDDRQSNSQLSSSS